MSTSAMLGIVIAILVILGGGYYYLEAQKPYSPITTASSTYPSEGTSVDSTYDTESMLDASMNVGAGAMQTH